MIFEPKVESKCTAELEVTFDLESTLLVLDDCNGECEESSEVVWGRRDA